MPYIHSDPVLDAEMYNADMDEQAKFEDIRYDVCDECGNLFRKETLIETEYGWLCKDCYEKEIAANEINKSQR